jgi:uncharacterized lipoprotein YmbA
MIRAPIGPRVLMIAAALGAGPLLGGCSADPARGYSFSSTFDHTVRTVAVPIFANETYASGLEVRLTEAIIAEIRRTTPWRVVGAESAATTLHGSIEEIELTRLSRQRNTGLVQEQAVQLTVNFEWIDNRTGEPTVSRRRFSSIASFVPHHGVGEPIEIAESGVVRELARDIVAELRSDW